MITNAGESISRNLVLDQVSRDFIQQRTLVPAVTNVCLEVQDGEFLTVVGPSGCGKTTLLRLIAGFEFPSRGHLWFDGIEISHTLPHQRPMAMVFQNYALFPHLNVFENIAFGLRLKRMREIEIQESVQIILHMLNLSGLEKRSPHQLSGGQQQRVALGRAMIMKPRLLLLDEPLSNLDAKLRAQMRIEIRHLQQRLGLTCIYVTHDQTEAMSLSDRVVVMNQGRIEQVGTPETIYQRPASIFVADFIGRANFIETQVITCQNRMATLWLWGQQLSLPCSPDVHANQKAYVVLRPESIKLCASTDGIGEIKSVSYFGNQIEYEVETEYSSLCIVDPDIQSGKILHKGSWVRLGIDPLQGYVLPFN